MCKESNHVNHVDKYVDNYYVSNQKSFFRTQSNNEIGVLNNYSRYQGTLRIEDLYPSPKDGTCACGCGNKLTGRKRRWFSSECRVKSVRDYFIIKGDTQVIRNTLYQLDEGYCRHCGQLSDDWEADHIFPVFLGGSACDITGFQTLCKECHKEKTRNDLNRVPDTMNGFTGSLDIFPPVCYTLWAFNEPSRENIIGNTVIGSNMLVSRF